MDAGNSFQVLLSTAVLTTLLIATIRVMGVIAAKSIPDIPQSVPRPLPADGPDALRLIAILTAAAMEALDSDDIYLSSVVELPEPGGHKHWPRVGKMHFYRKPGSAL